MALRFSRALRIVAVVGAVSALCWGAAVLAGEVGATAPVCWTDAALAYRKGEERVQKGIATAVVNPPQRAPAQFSPITGTPRGVIRRVKLPPGRKLVALTFDLCETRYEVAGYQGAIIDYLRANNVKATFFAGGKWLLTHRERAEQIMADPLFEVGNHSWEHRNLRRLAGTALKGEIANAQLAYEVVRAGLGAKQCRARDGAALAERAPPRITHLRFPYGACNPASLDAVAQEGLVPIQWDVAAGDPAPGESAAQMARIVLGAVQPGSIVVFHANGRGWHTDEALPKIVAELRAQGYQFVTVAELLAAGEPEIAATCFNQRPGDTDVYDHFMVAAEHGPAPKPASTPFSWELLGWDMRRFFQRPFGGKPDSL